MSCTGLYCVAIVRRNSYYKVFYYNFIPFFRLPKLYLLISPPLRSPYTIRDSSGIYRTANLDTTFNAARGFSITASFFGLLSFFTLGFASCCPIPQSRMKCISIYFLIAFFFQAMT